MDFHDTHDFVKFFPPKLPKLAFNEEWNELIFIPNKLNHFEGRIVGSGHTCLSKNKKNHLYYILIDNDLVSEMCLKFTLQ